MELVCARACFLVCLSMCLFVFVCVFVCVCVFVYLYDVGQPNGMYNFVFSVDISDHSARLWQIPKKMKTRFLFSAK